MKFARVNLEPESFGDHRFAHLARLLAMPGGDGHFALIKVALIWSWQTEHYTPDAPCFHVPEDVIEMALGVDGAVGRAALVRARLAEDTPDGLRMKGSSHDRTGWLWRIRAKSEAGGRAKAATAKRKAADKSLPEADHGHAQGVPVESPLSSLLSVPEEPDLSHRACGAGGALDQPDPVPGDTSPTAIDSSGDSILALLAEAASELNAERIRLDPTAHRVDDTTAGQLTRRLSATPAADRRRRLMHAVACVVAKARRTREVSSLRWSTFASEDAWAYVQDSTVADYAAGSSRHGHGARDPTPRQQVQQRRTPIRDLTAPKRADP